MRLTRRNRQHGYIIILTMIIVFVLTGTGLAVAGTVAAGYASTKRNTYVDAAVSTAEAGVTTTIAELTKSASFTGYPDTPAGRKEFYNNEAQGKAEYTTTVSDSANGTKTIVSTGYVYANNSLTSPSNITNKKTIEVVVKYHEADVTPSILTGSGGLYLTSATGPSGNVYLGGKLRMGNHATLGTSTKPVNLQVYGNGCSPQYSGPVTSCAANEDPAVIEYSASVYGQVCATGKTDSTNIIPASGLDVGCTPPPVRMPYFDKQAYANSMTTTELGSAGSCYGQYNTGTLKAKTKYNGNVKFDYFCQGVIEGDVYIDGDLTIDYTTGLTVKPGLETPPTIVVTGRADLGSHITKNDKGVSVRIISFNSSNGTCSRSSSCTTLNDDDMKASVNVEGIKCTFCTMDGGMLWAYFANVKISGPSSRPGKMGSVIGNFVDIRGYDYGADSWTDTPPSSVKMIVGYSVVGYKQKY